ncbi:MAG: TolC family outer membrane protein [Methylotenera sp.]
MLYKNSNYRLVILVLVTCLSGLAGNIAYATEPLLTLKEMVEKTVTSNPEVQSRYHKFLESGYEQEVMRAGFLPKADVVANYRKQEELVKPADGTATPRFNSELVLRQMIFDGFATNNEVKRLGHASRVRYYELQSAMQNTTLEFVRAYIDAMRYRELTQFAKDNYVVHKQLFDRIKERVTAGVARKVDLEQATGRLALAEANLLTEATNLHDVTARIQRLYGEIPPETLEAPTFFNAGVEPTAVEALKVAYNQNPDLLSTIEDIQSSQDEIKAREARYMPKLDLQARKNLGVSSDGRFSSSAADLLELTMNFNLFNGFSDHNSVNQAAQKLNNSKDLRDKACVDTRQIVVIAYNDIEQLKEQEKYRTEHKNAIENAREAYRKQFDIGQRTLLDLLDTENEYFQAKRTLTNTQYDIKTAYARTYAGQGQLLNKIGAARGGLPEYAREDYMDNENVCQSLAPEQLIIDKAALMADAKPLSSTYSLPKAVDVPVKPLEPLKAVEPPKPVELVKVPEPPKSVVKVLGNKVIPDVQFETNSAKIKPVSYPVLDNAVNTLKDWGNSNVEIAGHTDRRNTSKAAYNQKLSEKRAKAVLKYVVKKGIEAKRLTAKGYGFSQPIAENDSKLGNDVNRRVELIRLEK